MSSIDYPAALKAQRPPRDDAAARRFAADIMPWGGFVLYGILFLFLVANPVGLGVLFGVTALLAKLVGAPLPGWAGTLTVVCGIAGFVLSWWPFLAWARWRRNKWRQLYRHGEVTRATADRVWEARRFTFARLRMKRGETTWRARLTIPTAQLGADPPVEGSTWPVLVSPDLRVRHAGVLRTDRHVNPVYLRPDGQR